MSPENDPKILICGDSISAGILYDEQNSKYVRSPCGFVSLLQNSLTCAVQNVSRFGNTVLAAIPKLYKRLEGGQKPAAVLIELGGNDCAFNWSAVAENPDKDWRPITDIGEYGQALSGAVSHLRKEGIVPVLATLPPIDPERYFTWISKNDADTGARIMQWLGSVSRIYWWHERYSTAARRVAEKEHADCIDFRDAFLKTDDFRAYLCQDGMHPNAEGHRLIAGAIQDFLSEKYPTLLKSDIA